MASPERLPGEIRSYQELTPQESRMIQRGLTEEQVEALKTFPQFRFYIAQVKALHNRLSARALRPDGGYSLDFWRGVVWALHLVVDLEANLEIQARSARVREGSLKTFEKEVIDFPEEVGNASD